MKTLAATLSLLLYASFYTTPAAHADGTCTFAAPVIIISLAAPVTLVCGDGNTVDITHSTSIQFDPSLLGRAP